MYKTENHKTLTLKNIFKKAQTIFEQNGIVLPKKGLDAMKDTLDRRETREFLTECSRFSKDDIFNESTQYGKILERSSKSKEDELEYPYKLRYGILLTWCGAAMSLLSERVLAPAGVWVAGVGVVWSGEGLLELEQMRAEREKIKADKKTKEKEKSETFLKHKRKKT